MDKIYYVDSVKKDPVTWVQEECQTIYCNNPNAVKQVVKQAESFGRTNIKTGEAYFNASGILVKK